MSADGQRPGRGFVQAIIAGLVMARSRALPARPAPATGEAKSSDDPGYEASDVHVGNTARVMAGLMVAALTVVGSMAWLRHGFAAHQRQALPSLTPQQTARLAPPPPHLQVDRYADRDATRAAEDRRLDGYAFTDASRQRARIPIDRAMALTVGRTLDP